jgi:hypothetical protein
MGLAAADAVSFPPPSLRQEEDFLRWWIVKPNLTEIKENWMVYAQKLPAAEARAKKAGSCMCAKQKKQVRDAKKSESLGPSLWYFMQAAFLFLLPLWPVAWRALYFWNV